MSEQDQLLALLERRFPTLRLSLPNGVPVVILQYPSEVSVPDGEVQSAGVVLGWESDGRPLVVPFLRESGESVDAAFVDRAIARSSACRINLAGYSASDGALLGIVALDSNATAEVVVGWLMASAACCEDEARAAVERHYDGFAEIREFRARLNGPALRLLDPRDFTASQWFALSDCGWLADIADEWPAFRRILAELDLRKSEFRALRELSPQWVIAAALCAGMSKKVAATETDARLILRLRFLNNRREISPLSQGVLASNEVIALAFAFLRKLPPNWWPDDMPTFEAAVRCITALHAIAIGSRTSFEMRDLAKGCRGDWTGFQATLNAVTPDWFDLSEQASIPSGSLRTHLAAYIRDMVSAFANQIVLPMAVRVGAERDMVPPMVFNWSHPKSAAILFEGAGAVAILEAVERWHARRSLIETSISLGSPDFSASRSWQASMPRFDWMSPSGRSIEIVPLTNQRELAEEGAVGPDSFGVDGLSHCVGGFDFVRACMAGRKRIVSLREVSPEGVRKRLSTAEFWIDREAGYWQFRLVQHLGFRNREPEANARAAFEAYHSKLAGYDAQGRPLPEGPFNPPEDAFAPVTDDVAVASVCGFDWRSDGAMEQALRAWEPMMRRPLRGLSCDQFAIVTGIAPDPSKRVLPPEETGWVPPPELEFPPETVRAVNEMADRLRAFFLRTASEAVKA